MTTPDEHYIALLAEKFLVAHTQERGIAPTAADTRERAKRAITAAAIVAEELEAKYPGITERLLRFK